MDQVTNIAIEQQWMIEIADCNPQDIIAHSII